ncbi:hypothetical protein ICW40_05700 [Actinotalea ferrariae]|uniref:hypothetical protein n=1 Tax=Actinotalea ferrariae TaxID=1386098 RepID=UPI001C8C2CAB|nr:hypothetical protein [Actinotalea ferrariae]MBX9244300.1 hypothetical protein [Actinotalea ferrariae]
MTTTPDVPPQTRQSLTFDDAGLWAVQSDSQTQYLVDLRGAPRLLRQPGPASSRGPGDGQWVRLTSMRDVEVGQRAYYTTRHELAGEGWWLQRRITGIVAITDDAVPAMLTAAAAGELGGAPSPPEPIESLRARRAKLGAWLEERGVTGRTAELAAALSETVMIALAEFARIDQELDERGADPGGTAR